MDPVEVVVIAEAPTLAASLASLFESEGLGVHVVPTLEEAARHAPADRRRTPVFVSACHGFVSRSARAWQDGLFGERPLIAVGGRDPTLRASPRLHLVRLPLEPSELLGLVRRLARQALSWVPPAGPVDRRGNASDSTWPPD
jgi:hypothetical protein